jgi:16S rRNA (uracil1498-N3)-methyltransferase
MHSFYCESFESSMLLLNEEESSHATRVLRLRAGDVVLLLDGKGSRAEATLVEPHAKRCVLELKGDIHYEVSAAAGLHIAMAPTKNIDRFEWFLEKATEIGIKKITPLLTANSERKVVNQERLQKIVLSAMKQSQRLYLPELEEMKTFKKFVEKETGNSIRFIAHCEEREKKFFANEVQKIEDSILLIGPEGDFNPTEIDMALQAGFIPVSLGNARLRTETAGVYAASVYNT